MKSRAHVFVSGDVQGVFFRSNTRSSAIRLEVKGWVRNLFDGRVEAIFEGEKAQVEQMLEFCKRGPPGAAVDSVEVKWEKYKDEFDSFEVRY